MKSIVWFGLVLGAVSVAGKVFYAKPGQTVLFECGVSTFRNLVWSHGDQRIITVNGKTGFQRIVENYSLRSKLKLGTNLELSGVREEEAGSFFCETDGTKHEHTLVVVSVSVSPPNDLEPGSKAMLQCHVKGLTEGYTVQWRRPHETTSTGNEKVELKSVASSDAGTWTCVISHNGETHSEKLVLRVKAQTPTTSPSPTQHKDGSHSPTNPHYNTNTLPAVVKFSWWVWVAIGVGCLVVILLLIFVIVMCKTIRRKKRRFQYIENGRQPKQYCQCNCPTAAARPQQGRRKEKPLTLHMHTRLIE